MSAQRWLRIGAIAALGVAAFLGWLAAGMVVYISFLVTPESGQEIPVGILQVVSLVGWLAIVVWLVVDLGRGDLRFVLAPFVAWLWVLLVAIFVGNIASLSFGP